MHRLLDDERIDAPLVTMMLHHAYDPLSLLGAVARIESALSGRVIDPPSGTRAIARA